ncbi:REP-associated tyrosine transposase [Halopseudomonas sp.]|uniref:REP-associated tyrosine transposase n=1 Tax=Halopseudomonas sp. TaxID=2901191 RepID=UPI0030015C4E
MNPTERPHRGWYTSRRLPHFDSPDSLQFISFRLVDSLPQQLLSQWHRDLAALPAIERLTELRQRMEACLDRGLGCCVLGHPAMAATLQQAFNHHDGKRYRLLAWCIMPNHVHVLIKPEWPLAKIVQTWKVWSARRARDHAGQFNFALPARGLWMRGFWDRYIRDERHLLAVVEYIHQNPVKAGLCAKAEDWPWSSANRSC